MATDPSEPLVAGDDSMFLHLPRPDVPRPDIEGDMYRPHMLAWDRYDRFVKLRAELQALVKDARDEYLYVVGGDLMPRAEWLAAVKGGSLRAYDGHGYPYKNGYCSDSPYYPCDADDLPEDATHVMWINR